MKQKNHATISYFEFSDELNDAFITFLHSNGWHKTNQEEFPTIDTVEYTFYRAEIEITVIIEHWQKTKVHGNSKDLVNVESDFNSYIKQL